MKVHLRKTLQFFDDPTSRGHASGVIGLIGEELCAASFKHYIEHHEKRRARIFAEPVGMGRLKGKRLDRWIVTGEKSRKLYQCEIKNWSSTAIGGLRLAVDVDVKEVLAVAERNWKRQSGIVFSENGFPNNVTKVLLPMRPPKDFENFTVEPLLIYWMPIAAQMNSKPLWNITVSGLHNPLIKTPFKSLNVFSVSLYFRQLLKAKQKFIDLELPITEQRMEILQEILSR